MTLHQLQTFAAYKWRARTRYLLHSLFVYDLKMQVLEGKPSAAGAAIEAFRRELGKSREQIVIQDHGAGYGGDGRPERRVPLGEVVRSSARRRRTGELLSRFMAFHQPETGLELGTNLGFSTLYHLAGRPSMNWTTVEGSAALCALAARHFDRFNVRPSLINATFDDALQDLPMLDYVFLDGHHVGEATIRYVKALLPYMRPDSAIVIDDIHWSADMEAAWRTLIEWPEVSLSVDIYHLGILFIRQERAKQHFILNFGFP